MYNHPLLKILFVVVLLCIQQVSFAQERTISGKVLSSEDGMPLPGVSVLVKGTATGTTSNVDGEYRLNVPANAEILVFSYIGYVSQEVPIAGQSVINLTMRQDLQQLQEVVVIGYGEKSRKLMTESIGTVNAKDITKIPVASVDQALQGRISGVQITNVNGTPGSPTAVRIRGVGTVGNTQPLFVIDGIPIGKNVDQRTNPLATINPNDIESISVLKDASAAAVYGVQAANGVVLITTKRGSRGAPRVSIDAYQAVQQLPPLWEMTNTSQWLGLTTEANNNFNQQFGLVAGDPAFRVLHPDLLPGSRFLNISNEREWVRDITNNNAPMRDVNASVSGGTDNVRYFVSANAFSQDAMVGKWQLDRYSFRTNTEYTPTKKLKITNNMQLSYLENYRGMSTGGDGFLLRNAAVMPPFFEIYENPDFPSPGLNRYGFTGNVDVGGITRFNSNATDRLIDNYDRRTRLIASLVAEYEIISGLSFKTANSIDANWSRDNFFRPAYNVFEVGLDRLVNEASEGRSEAWTKVFTNTLNYNNTFGKHTFNALAGTEYRPFRSWFLGARAENFVSAEPTFYALISNGSGQQISSGAGQGAYLSYFGRMSYDFNQKYLLTVTVRRDGTWKFSPDDRRNWGTFPSVSGAWRIGQEDFFKGLPVVSDLKLRASWGQLGNDDTGFFPHIFQITTDPDYGLGQTSVQGAVPVNFVNRDVTWETVETIDLGFDAGFFNDKVTLLATYYQRRTRDFLIGLPLPRVTGFGSTAANFGEVLNQGVELELGYSNTFRNGFRLDISANLTTVKNELVSIREGVTEFASGNYRTAVGFPIGYFYGFRTAGIYQTDAEAAAALPDPLSPQGPRAGDVRFVDTNGPASADAAPGVLFSGEPDGRITPEDRAFLGKTIPDFFYGLNIGMGYKGFDFTMLWQGVGGVQLYNQFRADGERLTGGGINYLATVQNRWTGPNTSNTMPRAIAGDPNNNNRFSDRWIEDAGFLRLRNVQLGYTFPSALLEKTKSITNLRIYLAASNLLTFTNYSGPDPEVFTFGQIANQLQAGTDQGIMPQARIFQAGIQLSF